MICAGFLPFILIGLAYMRGREIGKKRLLIWPLAAFALAGMPVAYGIIARATEYSIDVAVNPGSTIYTQSIGIAAMLCPLIFHIICVIQGLKTSSNNLSTLEASPS
ncbi:MAG: hypothetical protein AAB276_01815, partial [Pseudomonadota bacterium]